MTIKALQGSLGVYNIQNTGIIDYHLLKLQALFLDTANRDFNRETLGKLSAIRKEQDLLLDARLECM